MVPKPLLAAMLLAALWVLEGVVPFFPRRQRRLRHYAANLGLALVNAVAGALLFTGALLYATEWARVNGFGLLHWLSLPAAAELGLAIVLFDAWQYAWHRLNHCVPLLWRFHAVHHADTALDASSAVRFHFGEILLSHAARLAVLPALGMTLPQLAAYELLLLPIIFVHHSNVALPAPLDRALRWLIVTPRMHWVHHSRLRAETDSNYASIFSFWDRLFGSHCARECLDDLEFGLGEPSATANRLPSMLMRPFLTQSRVAQSPTSQSPPPAL